MAPGVTLSLPPPASLHRAVEAQQLITAHYAGNTFIFETRVSVTPSRILVVATDTLGRRGATIMWDGTAMRVETAPWAPSALRPANVLADIVSLHWPLAVLSAALAPPASLTEPQAGQRVIAAGGQAMIRIEHLAGAAGSWTGRWAYRNLAWGYELDVASVEIAP